MRLRTILLLFTTTFLSVSLLADDFWENKPSAEWSEKDLKKLMEDSPWSSKFPISEVVIQQTSRSVDAVDRDFQKEMWYRAQFWTALPMREAQARLQQFQVKYNQMKPEDKKVFDERAKQFIERQYPDTIIIRITYGSNVDDWGRKLATFWAEQTSDLQKNNIFLVTNGKRVPMLSLQQTQPGSREFYVIFPRQVDGEVIGTKPDAKIGIEFQHPDSVGPKSANGQRVWMQFRPGKMIYRGNLAL
jgi:hypothetical protein